MNAMLASFLIFIEWCSTMIIRHPNQPSLISFKRSRISPSFELIWNKILQYQGTGTCEENVLNFFFKGSWSLRSPVLGRSGLAPPTSPQGPSAAAPRSTSRFLAFIALLRLTWELTLNGIDSHISWQQNLHSLFCPPCYCSLELVHLLQDALVTVWWKTFCNFTQELRSSLTLWCQSKKYIWSEILSLKLFQCVATHIISKFYPCNMEVNNKNKRQQHQKWTSTTTTKIVDINRNKNHQH